MKVTIDLTKNDTWVSELSNYGDPYNEYYIYLRTDKYIRILTDNIELGFIKYILIRRVDMKWVIKTEGSWLKHGEGDPFDAEYIVTHGVISNIDTFEFKYVNKNLKAPDNIETKTVNSWKDMVDFVEYAKAELN